MIRRKSLDLSDHWFDDRFNAIEEVDLIVRIGANWKVDYCAEVLGKWRIHEESWTWKKPKSFTGEKELMLRKLEKKNINTLDSRSHRQLLTTPRIAVAMICAMVSYAMMNLVMTSTPLAVVGCGYSPNDAANVVSAHVIAMFLPSFFTGHLIARYGEELIVGIGLFFLAFAGLVALTGVQLENFFIALIFIGLGWNFGFIGATTMLTNSHSESERGRMQGINDLFVFGGVTVASFSSGGLMNCTGGDHLTGWTSVNLAMFPMLAIAGVALIWLLQNKKPSSNKT